MAENLDRPGLQPDVPPGEDEVLGDLEHVVEAVRDVEERVPLLQLVVRGRLGGAGQREPPEIGLRDLGAGAEDGDLRGPRADVHRDLMRRIGGGGRLRQPGDVDHVLGVRRSGCRPAQRVEPATARDRDRAGELRRVDRVRARAAGELGGLDAVERVGLDADHERAVAERHVASRCSTRVSKPSRRG